jgi:integrase
VHRQALTLLYTGVRVSELVGIKLSDVEFDRCQVRINQGKGGKDRVVPSRPPSRKHWRCITIACDSAAPAICLSRHGRSRTATAACAACSSATPLLPGYHSQSHHTGCAISC